MKKGKLLRKARKVLRAEYGRGFPEGDRLGRVAKLIDWDEFRPILEPLFKNSGGEGPISTSS